MMLFDLSLPESGDRSRAALRMLLALAPDVSDRIQLRCIAGEVCNECAKALTTLPSLGRAVRASPSARNWRSNKRTRCEANRTLANTTTYWRRAPKDAILSGADYLVIGKPITDASYPLSKAQQILSEMQEAFDSLPQSNAS